MVYVKCIKTVDLISGSISDFGYAVKLDSVSTTSKTLPTYGVNPSQCASSPFTYELVYVAGPAISGFPAFVN
jgi:hypothetical protein